MKSDRYLLGGSIALAVVALLLLNFENRDRSPSSGAALYDPAREVVAKGVVENIWDFACPQSEGQMGRHLLLRTSRGYEEIHLGPSRVLRRQPMILATGDQVEVVGSQVLVHGRNDVLARKVTRGPDIMVLRDQRGNLLLHE
jgi:hypothetical protein